MCVANLISSIHFGFLGLVKCFVKSNCSQLITSQDPVGCASSSPGRAEGVFAMARPSSALCDILDAWETVGEEEQTTDESKFRRTLLNLVKEIADAEGITWVQAFATLANVVTEARHENETPSQASTEEVQPETPTRCQGDVSPDLTRLDQEGLLHCGLCGVFLKDTQLKRGQCPVCLPQASENIPKHEPDPVADNRIMGFGKHEYKTRFWVIHNDKGYCKWCLQNPQLLKSPDAKEWEVYLKGFYFLARDRNNKEQLVERTDDPPAAPPIKKGMAQKKREDKLKAMLRQVVLSSSSSSSNS